MFKCSKILVDFQNNKKLTKTEKQLIKCTKSVEKKLTFQQRRSSGLFEKTKRKNLKRAAFDFSMKLKQLITRSCETKNPELEMKKAFKLQGAVIRYSPNSGVVPYFSEILPVYLIDAHFPKNSQNPVPYRHPFLRNANFYRFPKNCHQERLSQFYTVYTHNSDTLFDLTKMSLFWEQEDFARKIH